MADLNRQMVNLSKKINVLEKKLGESSAELAELRVVLAPFLARYKKVLNQHERLVEILRELNDARSIQGDQGAKQPGDAETALTRLLYGRDIIPGQGMPSRLKRYWPAKIRSHWTILPAGILFLPMPHF